MRFYFWRKGKQKDREQPGREAVGCQRKIGVEGAFGGRPINEFAVAEEEGGVVKIDSVTGDENQVGNYNNQAGGDEEQRKHNVQLLEERHWGHGQDRKQCFDLRRSALRQLNCSDFGLLVLVGTILSWITNAIQTLDFEGAGEFVFFRVF